jgi:hypothetical protein
MFNPLRNLTVQLLEALEKNGTHFLVSQSYSRGDQTAGGTGRTSLLMTRYRDLDLATIHYESISKDKFRSILHLKHPRHYNKLLELLVPDSQFNLFVDLIADKALMNRFLNELYTKCLEKYIRHHTSLDIKRAGALRKEVNLVYGKWYVQIKYANQQIQVALDELERLTGIEN